MSKIITSNQIDFLFFESQNQFRRPPRRPIVPYFPVLTNKHAKKQPCYTKHYCSQYHQLPAPEQLPTVGPVLFLYLLERD